MGNTSKYSQRHHGRMCTHVCRKYKLILQRSNLIVCKIPEEPIRKGTGRGLQRRQTIQLLNQIWQQAKKKIHFTVTKTFHSGDSHLIEVPYSLEHLHTRCNDYYLWSKGLLFATICFNALSEWQSFSGCLLEWPIFHRPILNQLW